jgi:amidohydrolase family protein
MLMMGPNTPMTSPIGQDPAGPGRVTPGDFRTAAAGHAAYMDERNIDVQVMGPRLFLIMGWMEPDLSGCLDELDRCVRDCGFVAAYFFPDPAGRRTTPGMHEPYWFPLYERAEELGIPLIVHGTNSLDPRYRVVPHNYQLGFLTEQYLAGQFLSHGDVFTRYPDLFYDTCDYDLNFLEAAIKQRGVGRTLFGTEAPGSGRAVRPETGRTSDDLVPVIGGFGFLSEADKVAIFNENPARVIPALAKSSPGGTTPRTPRGVSEENATLSDTHHA